MDDYYDESKSESREQVCVYEYNDECIKFSAIVFF